MPPKPEPCSNLCRHRPSSLIAHDARLTTRNCNHSTWHPHTHTEQHSCICTLDHVRLIPFACRWLLGHTTWGSSNNSSSGSRGSSMLRLQQPNCSRNRDSATCHIIESHSPAAFDIDTHTHTHTPTQTLRLVQSTANSCRSPSRNQSQRQSHGPCHSPEAFACAPQICLSVFQGNPNCSQPHFADSTCPLDAPPPPLPPLPTYQCQVAIPRISLFDFSCSASGVEFNCWSIAAVLAAEAVQILREDNGNIAFLFVTIDFDMIIDFVHNMLAVK